MSLNRLYGVDLLKVFACLGVIILHVTTLAFDINQSMNINGYLYYIGTFSIPLFFIVNGYFLLNKKVLTYAYVAKKMVSILFLVALWTLLHWFVLGNFHEDPIRKMLGALLQRGYFYQFWFFGSMLIIYPTLPLLQKLTSNIKVHIGLTFLFLLIGCGLQVSNFFIPNPPIQRMVIQTLRLWTWYSYYLIGGLLGRKQVRTLIYSLPLQKIRIITFISVIVSPFLFYYICQNIFNLKYAEFFYDSIFVKLISIMIFLSFAYVTFEGSFKKVIELLSGTTMGIFIVHAHLIKLFDKFIDMGNSLINIGAIILIFLLSFVVSYLISKIKYIKKLVEV